MDLGFGIGLRPHYYKELSNADSPDHPVDCYEIISENYMFSQGRPKEWLEKFREKTPIAMHGVSLSIGSSDPIPKSYLKSLKEFMLWLDPALISDHLCWGGIDGENMHDLLPLPQTRESLQHLSDRIDQVQSFLGRQICLENVSSYVNFRSHEYPEWEFLNTIAQKTGCGILLDINNIYVNSVNHNFDPETYINAIHPGSVKQFHLAGHSQRGNYLFDTHNTLICAEVWALYNTALKRFPSAPTMIEWDSDFPNLEVLIAELLKAKAFKEEMGRT